MSYSAKSIANYFLSLGAQEGSSMNVMKVQKLVYFANGWHLAIFDEPLIDEFVEAWRFGPVIPSINHEFARFGNNTIDNYAASFYKGPKGSLMPIKTPAPENNNTIALLDKIWEVYGNLSAVQLANASHSVGTSWEQTWHEDIPINTNIDNDLIKEYFIGKTRKYARS